MPPRQEGDRRNDRETRPTRWVKPAIAVGVAVTLLVVGTIVDRFANQPISPPPQPIPSGAPRPPEDPRRLPPTATVFRAATATEVARISDNDIINQAAKSLGIPQQANEQTLFAGLPAVTPEGTNLVDATKRLSHGLELMEKSGNRVYTNAQKFLAVQRDQFSNLHLGAINTKSSNLLPDVQTSLAFPFTTNIPENQILLFADAAYTDGHTLALLLTYASKYLERMITIFDAVKTNNATQTRDRFAQEVQKQSVRVTSEADAYSTTLLGLLEAVALDESVLSLSSPQMKMMRTDLATFIRVYGANQKHPDLERFIKNKLFPANFV